MGIAPGDHGLNGFLDAYDAETGERLMWDSITAGRACSEMGR